MPEWSNFTSSDLVGNKISYPRARDDNDAYEMNTNSPSQRGASGAGAGVDQIPISQDNTQEELPAAMRGLGVARHTLGLLLLLLVVVLWTTCNFLGSSIFADNSYAKPFFLTYLNTSTFMLAMVPSMLRSFWNLWRRGLWKDRVDEVRRRYRRGGWRAVTQDPGVGIGQNKIGRNEIGKDLDEEEDEHSDEGEGLLNRSTTDRRPTSSLRRPDAPKRTHLALLPTAKLALAFCFLWFAANYFALGCLQFTTVASTTILTSTSSIWTLLIGAITRTERFTWRKLIGVLASLFGIALISKLDMGSGASTSENDGTANTATLLMRAVKEFPDKTSSELLLGDSLALLSAVIYGLYTVMLAKTTKSAAPLELNMPLFFGFVGTWNFVLLMPLFPLLHYTSIETFELPPTGRIWSILILNSISALASDICWAYAMVLTSPLVVTVGLSLTIPLSLVGEMVIQGRYEGWLYWLGAVVVVGSFVFVDREERSDEDGGAADSGGHAGGLTEGMGRTDVGGAVVDR